MMPPRPTNQPTATLLALLALAACSGGTDDDASRADLAAVTRDKLKISVTESGEIKAARSTRVKNLMEGRSTVIYLIEEGTNVEKGDKLVELDASNQIERRATQEISLEKSNASVLTSRKNLEIPDERMNIHGSGCSIGHPIGATGARIVVALIHVLAEKEANKGLATLCIGGGEALATIWERV